nr:hypothetical protein [uncultured Friedmanniella sp.]
MVYVPLPPAQARALRAGESLDLLRGHAATPSLRRELAVAEDDEEGDFAALNAAGVAALSELGDLSEPGGTRRLVLAAEVDASQVVDAQGAWGEVQVLGLTWPQVQSLFADEEAAGPAVRAAARDAAGLEPRQAYDLPAVLALTDSYDLLWFGPAELDDLS